MDGKSPLLNLCGCTRTFTYVMCNNGSINYECIFLNDFFIIITIVIIDRKLSRMADGVWKRKNTKRIRRRKRAKNTIGGFFDLPSNSCKTHAHDSLNNITVIFLGCLFELSKHSMYTVSLFIPCSFTHSSGVVESLSHRPTAAQYRTYAFVNTLYYYACSCVLTCKTTPNISICK